MIVTDVETSGTDPSKHSIVSIGAVDFGRPDRTFYRECRVFDGADVEADALAVNGFTMAQITDTSKPTLEVIVGEFVSWCRDVDVRTIGGHNASFDRDFLQASADRYKLAWRFGHRVLDLHSFSWMHMVRHGHTPPTRGGRSSISLDVTLEYVGLPEEPKPHNGLVGAKMEAEAFCRLMHGRGLLSEYADHPLPAHVALSTPTSDQQALF